MSNAKLLADFSETFLSIMLEKGFKFPALEKGLEEALQKTIKAEGGQGTGTNAS